MAFNLLLGSSFFIWIIELYSIIVFVFHFDLPCPHDFNFMLLFILCICGAYISALIILKWKYIGITLLIMHCLSILVYIIFIVYVVIMFSSVAGGH